MISTPGLKYMLKSGRHCKTALIHAKDNPRTYKQIHIPTVVPGGGGVDGIPPQSF